MKITTLGLDLAKNVFQVHGVDEHGKARLKKKLRRAQVIEFFANLPPCLIGMEACGSAHYWARRLQALGHTVKLIPPQYVKAYVKTNKNDAADAEAICEAVGRPNMRFVPIKTVEQQAVLAVHRVRHGLVKARTAQSNQIRGLLGEFGVVIPKGIAKVFQQLPEIIENTNGELPGTFALLLQRMLERLKELDRQVKQLEAQITQWHLQHADSRRLEAIPGIGALGASALVATVGDPGNFAKARHLAAWMGVVPRQHSTGGKQQLLGISKHGDTYLRTLIIHGARSVVKAVQCKPNPDERWRWLLELIKRRGPNIAAVALANKNARIAWALLARQRDFQSDYHHEAPQCLAGRMRQSVASDPPQAYGLDRGPQGFASPGFARP